MALINGLVDLPIHNDAGNKRIDDEITLFTLFQAINSLPNEYINEAYDMVYTKCKLTDNAITNFGKAMNRYQHLHSSPFVWVKIIKRWNNEYYNDVIKPLMIDYDIVLNKIDLNDSFNINSIRSRVENHYYKSNRDVISDLSKVLRLVDDGDDNYIMKSFDSYTNTYKLKFVSDAFITKQLKRMMLWKHNDESITVHTVLLNHLSRFVVKGVKFYSTDDEVLSLFHGYKYNQLKTVNESIIKPYLDLIKDVICDNNETVYEYVLNWISFIVQKPGVKTETALVLKGLQGIGKNRFTDTLCEMLSGYSAKNITDISELTGQFNSIIEGKMLIVLNEVKNCGDDRFANFNALKSIITDDVIRINEKLQPRHDAENVSNFIFVSNNAYPVKIEHGDRRYIVLACNGKHKNDFNYFNQLCSNMNEEFYDNLLTYFIKRNITQFNQRLIPMTQAKLDLIDASRSPIDIWICDNYDNLVRGMLCSDAIENKPDEIKERVFQFMLKDKCDRIKKQINKHCSWYYVLKNDCKQIYSQTIDDNINTDDDVHI